MSPAEIRQLIDIYTLPDPKIKEGIVQELLAEKLIRNGSHGYECTERGNKMCELLTEVPLPIQVWTDPRSAK
jgi:hypothetical protein